LRIKREMTAGRVNIERGDMEGFGASERVLRRMFGQAKGILFSVNEERAAFEGALTGLVREGLEALLVVLAMSGLARKQGLEYAQAPVHIGWGIALAAAGATWAIWPDLAAPGVRRELLEGVFSLLSAGVLLAASTSVHLPGVIARIGMHARGGNSRSPGDG